MKMLLVIFVFLVAATIDASVIRRNEVEDCEEEEEISFAEGGKPVQLWPNATVYYQIDEASNYTKKYLAKIQQAIDHFKEHTCIRWIKKPKDSKYRPYVLIYSGKGCTAVAAYQPHYKDERPQKMSLAKGCGFDIILHEMMHTLGWPHEHVRPDRDEYVKIHWENILPDRVSNFLKKPARSFPTLDTPYDFSSIMHYWTWAFSKNSKPTISARKEGVVIRPKREPGFSKLDIVKINKAYCGKV